MKTLLFILLSLAIVSFAQEDAAYCLGSFCAPSCSASNQANCTSFDNQDTCYDSLLYGEWDTYTQYCTPTNPTFYEPLNTCAQNMCNGMGPGIGYCIVFNHRKAYNNCKDDTDCNKYINCVSYSCNATEVACRDTCVVTANNATNALEKAFVACANYATD